MRSREHYGDVLQLRADLWRVPFAMCVGAVLFFLVTVSVDHAADRGSLTLPRWISIGGVDDARAILGAMLGAVSTVLALIFSVALLVLSMAVSNFGPRILARFVRDAITQVTIGLFLASVTHTLLTFIVTRQDATSRFVPQLTIMCSVALVMLSFAFLVVFSHRIAMSVRTQNVVARIVADLDRALTEVVAELNRLPLLRKTPEGVAAREALVARGTAEGGIVRARRTGFVQTVNVARLLGAAERSDAAVCLLHRPGQFVMEGAPFAQVVPAARATELAPAILGNARIGTHRTLEQDIEFGIAQLVEIALRALSPAINDTFTGLTCIDWLGDELRVMAPVAGGMGACCDAGGTIRLVWPPLRFARLVGIAFNQIRQAAAGNPAVTIRLLQTFARLAEQIGDTKVREPLSRQAEAVWETASAEALVKLDRADVEAAYRWACETLGTPDRSPDRLCELGGGGVTP
jgi:uncharacterized membrane protein